MRSILLALLALALPGLAAAQTPELPRQMGLHYFALENLTTGEIEQFGVAGANGIAHESIVLAPNTVYRDWILQAATLHTGSVILRAGASGQRLEIGPILLAPSGFPDTDGDGLPDDGELVLGTDPNDPDSDEDGVSDAAEAQQGSNPLDGRPARTGILASVATAGTTVDVCAANDMVAVADSEAGVAVFNVFSQMNPVIVAQVDTPGTAARVACDGALVAVADGDRGLAVIDLRDPPAARVLHQVPFPAAVDAVAAGGGIGYAGLASGEVVALDLATGTILASVLLPDAIRDLALAGDHLYALTPTTLHVISFADGLFQAVGSAASPSQPGLPNVRLFAATDLAFTTHYRGYNAFSLADPVHPSLILANTTAQFGWRQIVPNGSGLAVAAVGPNAGPGNDDDVLLFDVREPAQPGEFITTFVTPGAARAVTIYNGLVYAADTIGMQVINPLPFDSQHVPPTIALAASFSLAPAAAPEGQPVRVTALVADDVQVRNVEFYVDGQKVATDGSFPFELRFTTPLVRQQPSFRLRARASDTGGNATSTEELVVTLLQDTTPPHVVRTIPGAGALVGPRSVGSVAAYFSESLDPATVTAATVGVLDPDGAPVPVTLSYRAEARLVLLSLAGALAPGSYTGRVSPPLADLAGNPIASEFTWTFRVYDRNGPDRDGDGVPDEVEIALGLNPDAADSDSNGTPDGREDQDGDGLSNAGEMIVGTDPTAADSDGDGIRDGDEDTDFDLVKDGEETTVGSDPFAIDTDGDGVADRDEITLGTDPLGAGSQPPRTLSSSAVGYLNAIVGEPPTAGFFTSSVVSYENQ